MPIKVWTFAFNAIAGRAMPACDDEAAVQHAFDRNLELHASLEDIGFEGVFFSEHHFLNSLSPNPNLLVPALAQRTRRLKIGVLGNVLAFHQPWRLAEDLAMLDYLTQGRLEIGFAGGIATELAYMGISPDDARAMFAEALDIVELAWRERTVTYRGRFFTLDALPILPRMRRETRRRKWLTLYSEGTARLAARRGYKICTAFQSVEAAKRVYDVYRDEAGRIGYRVSDDDVGLRRQVLVWDDDASAAHLHAEVQEASRARINDIHSQLEARRAAGGAVPAKVNLLEGLLDPASEFLCGSPRTVADLILGQCRRVGAGHFVAYHPAALDEGELAHHYELWRDVIAVLRAAP